MFQIVEQSVPELLRISNSVRDDILMYLVVAVFFVRLVYIQVSFSGPELYRSLIKDFVAGYLLLYLTPPLIEELSKFPEQLFQILGTEPLMVDLTKSPEFEEGANPIVDGFGIEETLTKIGHYLWVVIFAIVYLIWVLAYSAIVALNSFFIFLGTICGRKSVLGFYVSLLVCLLCFPVIWVVFDKVVAVVLPKEGVGKIFSTIMIYILKIYVTAKAAMGLYNSKAGKFVRGKAAEVKNDGKKVASLVAKAPGMKQGVEAGSAVMEYGANKIENLKANRQLKPKVETNQSNNSSVKPSTLNSESTEDPKRTFRSGAISKKIRRATDQGSESMREQTRSIRARSFNGKNIGNYKNPVKAYGFSKTGEVSSSDIPKEVFNSAKNLSGYSKPHRDDSLTYNPDGNFLYSKIGMNKSWDVERKHQYQQQIKSFNNDLLGKVNSYGGVK